MINNINGVSDNFVYLRFLITMISHKTYRNMEIREDVLTLSSLLACVIIFIKGIGCI
jgi:hypothetical protein